MSIAAVTIALRNVLHAAAPRGVIVSTLSLAQAERQRPAARLNLALGSVAPASSVVRQALAARRLADRAEPAALELRYLLTAYGSEDLAAYNSPERLLELGMNTLQRTPVLRASDLEAALSPDTTAQPMHARIVVETFDLMELAMLFTSARAALRPAIIYKVQLAAT